MELRRPGRGSHLYRRRDQRQVAQATAAQKAALFNYELTIQNAFADVDNALVARQKLMEQQAAQERLVKALREYERLAYHTIQGRLHAVFHGAAGQQQLFPARAQLCHRRARRSSQLVVTLYQATGGGWVDIAEQASVEAPMRKRRGNA